MNVHVQMYLLAKTFPASANVKRYTRLKTKHIGLAVKQSNC